MKEWHKKIKFDGIWLDMSEASSFCVGSCETGILQYNPIHPWYPGMPGDPGYVDFTYPEAFEVTNATDAAVASAAADEQATILASINAVIPTPTYPVTRATVTPGFRDVNHPPYVINNVAGDISVNAIAPNATHSDGSQEYEMHSLNGYNIINATYHALFDISPKKRPFIIGQSTFLGIGRWADHWGGDNHSKWGSMYFSIPQALSFPLFGVPMFGTDTCWFGGNSDDNRWMQLSAFFPFTTQPGVLDRSHPISCPQPDMPAQGIPRQASGGQPSYRPQLPCAGVTAQSVCLCLHYSVGCCTAE